MERRRRPLLGLLWRSLPVCALNSAAQRAERLPVAHRGTGRTSTSLRTHDSYQLTTLLVWGHAPSPARHWPRHPARRHLHPPPTTPPTASSIRKRWTRPSRSRHPRWEIRTWCRRQGLQVALPRPAKMTARFVRLVPASKWTGNARPEPSVAILAVCPEHSFRLRGHPNGPGQCFGTPQSRRKITMRPSARLLFATAFIGGLDNAALAGSRASLADLLGQGYEVKATSTLPLVDS